MMFVPKATRIGGIAIDRPRPLVVAQSKFHAADTGFGVIERGENDRRAELTFVDQIRRQFIIAVETNGEARNDDLADPEIEIMRPLRLDGVVLLNGRGGRCIVEERNRGGRDECERRRHEVARIAGMHRRCFGRLPDSVHARADLIFIGKLIDRVETQARVGAGKIRPSS